MWGKIIGAMAGFAMGGPLGAVVGAALGHAAESGGFAQMRFGLPGANQFGAARMAARARGDNRLLLPVIPA